MMALIFLALWRNVDYYICMNSRIETINLEGKHFYTGFQPVAKGEKE